MKKLLLYAFSCLLVVIARAQEYELRSPDGKLSAKIEINQGIRAGLSKQGKPVISIEKLSLETDADLLPGETYRVQRTMRNSVNETVKPEIKEKSAAHINRYNELSIRFRGNLSITFRLFDEGLAYRFSSSLKDSLIVLRENMNINVDKSDSAWFQSSKTFNSSYETPYEHDGISSIGKGKLCNLPFLIRKADGLFVMISETDLYNYPGLWLTGTGENQLSATHAPYPKSLSYSGSIYRHGQIAETHDYIAKTSGARDFPWRIFAVADDEKMLVANHLVYLLSSPCALDDVDWIKPGVVMFDWWAKMNIYGVDFKAGINTETAKYFIDFCAENGFRYFLFDDGWCPKDDLLAVVPGLDMEEVTAYGREKGVDIMVWVIWHAMEKQWDKAFDQFEKWGIRGLKMDFMNRDDQRMVEFYEAFAKKAAEKKMVVNFHGAYKPSGLRRKYPNVLTREALIEFEYNGWTNHDNPVHHNLLPYIRMFTGPMDYIPATMRNSTKDNFRMLKDYPMGQGTRAHAMALFVILNSPMTMLPDAPSDYYHEEECTKFLSKIPVEWDETTLLQGKIGQFTVLARRSGENWHIGAISNWDERALDLETIFLSPGKYRLEAIADGINANSRAEDYKKISFDFQAGETIKLNLASGGGWVARISPAK